MLDPRVAVYLKLHQLAISDGSRRRRCCAAAEVSRSVTTSKRKTFDAPIKAINNQSEKTINVKRTLHNDPGARQGTRRYISQNSQPCNNVPAACKLAPVRLPPSIRGTTSLQRANWRFPSASEFSSRLAGTFLYPVETVGARNSVGGGENIFLAFLQTVPDHDTPSLHLLYAWFILCDTCPGLCSSPGGRHPLFRASLSCR